MARIPEAWALEVLNLVPVPVFLAAEWTEKNTKNFRIIF